MDSSRRRTAYFANRGNRFIGLSLCLCLLSLLGVPAPVLSQSCSDGDGGKQGQAEAPVQRVGMVRSRNDLNLSWLRPADFIKLHYFRGEPYQLADHEGLDFIHSDESVAQVPVYAAAQGTVVYVQRGCPQSTLFGTNYDQRKCGSGWGNHVVIRHSNGLWTRYAHLHPDGIQIQVLQQVERGELLAEMGNSGQSNTRHLHFEVGVASEFDPCAAPQSFHYVYDPAAHLNWVDLRH